MRAKLINEAKIEPNKELFDQFKQIFIEVLESGTHDPFAELNDRLNSLNIYLVDFQGHLDNLSPEERRQFQSAAMIPELGIRIMGYDPPSNQIFIAVDETFDDKFIQISSQQLNMHLNRMWSGFGHETIHMKQVDKMKVRQDPEFHSHKEYHENKQEIMAMAFSFVEEMRDFHSDEEILNLLKTGSAPDPPIGMRLPPGMPPPQHPLYTTYKDLGGKAFKLFSKYVYQYLQEENEELE